MSETSLAAETPKRPDAQAAHAAEVANARLDADNVFKEDVKQAADKRAKALEKYPDESLGGVIERAWDAVRGEDPCYAETAGPFREKLATHAESVQRTGLPENPSDFEREVAKLLAEQDKKQKRGGMAQTQPQAESWVDSAAREDANDARFSGDEGSEAPEHADAGSTSPKRGKLPDDFPHRAALEAAGINTYAQARKAHESGFADVSGIGEARASDIGDALSD